MSSDNTLLALLAMGGAWALYRRQQGLPIFPILPGSPLAAGTASAPAPAPEQPKGPDGGPPIPTGDGSTVTTPAGNAVPIVRPALNQSVKPGSPVSYTPSRWATPWDLLVRTDLAAAVESAKYDLASYLDLPAGAHLSEITVFRADGGIIDLGYQGHVFTYRYQGGGAVGFVLKRDGF